MKNLLLYPADSTPTPSSAPASTPTPIEGAGGSAPGNDDLPDDGREASDFDWAAESTGVEGNEREPAQPPAQEPPAQQPPQQQPPAQAPQQPPAPVQQPPAQQPPAQQPAQQPGQQAQPPAQGEQPPAQQPPAQQPPAAAVGETPEQKQQREQREAEAAAAFTQQLENYYQIPEELAARLPTEPEKVLPVIAAKLHQSVLRGMEAWATKAIPAFFAHHQQVTEANSASRKAFFDRWPGLSAHEKNVLEVGAMYRKMNPKATQQDVIEKVGQIVYAALGQQPPVRGNGQPAPQQNRGVPAPVRPAGASGSQAGAEPPADNLFTSMAEDFLQGDQKAE